MKIKITKEEVIPNKRERKPSPLIDGGRGKVIGKVYQFEEPIAVLPDDIAKLERLKKLVPEMFFIEYRKYGGLLYFQKEENCYFLKRGVVRDEDNY
jgi:hypothetical protein